MKKISRAVTKEKLIKANDNLYTENVISLDDKKNRKYFNSYMYQQYLQNENKGEFKKEGDTNDES